MNKQFYYYYLDNKLLTVKETPLKRIKLQCGYSGYGIVYNNIDYIILDISYNKIATNYYLRLR